MKLHRLKKANDYEVENWLIKTLKLTDYQRDKLKRDELIRFSEYYFYENKQKEKVNILMRLTIIFFSIFTILLFVGLPITFLFTGKWGYGSWLHHYFGKWQNKLGL